MPGFGTKAEFCCGDPQCFEKRAKRDVARMAVEVIDAVAAGIEAVHHQMVVRQDAKAPRLSVVAAGRPARQIKDRTRRVAHERAKRWPTPPRPLECSKSTACDLRAVSPVGIMWVIVTARTDECLT